MKENEEKKPNNFQKIIKKRSDQMCVVHPLTSTIIVEYNMHLQTALRALEYRISYYWMKKHGKIARFQVAKVR